MDGDLTAVGCRLDGNKLGFPDAIAAWLQSFFFVPCVYGVMITNWREMFFEIEKLIKVCARGTGSTPFPPAVSGHCLTGRPHQWRHAQQWHYLWVQSMQSSVVSFWESMKTEGVSNQLCQQHVFGKKCQIMLRWSERDTFLRWTEPIAHDNHHIGAFVELLEELKTTPR